MQREEELKAIKVDLLSTIVYKKRLIESFEDMLANPDLRTGRKERQQRNQLQRQVDTLFRQLAKANLELRNLKYGKQARAERRKKENTG